MKKMWLVYDGSIWYEDLLRSSGWTDETLRAPYACRVRERTDEPTCDKRGELIDDIEALCLSIEKRQNELSRLVKKLKG
tara:strand:- start:2835 stop:3071 length:237 start_codon:yes stop_codon:yes gene_type:complete